MPVWCAANSYPLFSNVCHALKEYTIDFQIPLHSATDMSTSTALVNELCQAFYLDITLGFSWYQHDWCPWFDVCLGIYSKGLRSRSFGRYTREKPRSGSSRTPSSHGWPDITWLPFFLWYQTWIQVREEGQWSTSYMSMIEFLLQYHCMTVCHCCVFLCIILLSLVFISLMNQSLDVQMHWPSSAQEEKFQFFRQGFMVNRR